MKTNLYKALSFALALCIVFGCMPFAVFAADAVHISTAEEFIAFTNGPSDADAVLDADIDLGEWTTAFADGFSGTLDGSGHAVTYTKTNPTGNFHALIKILNEGGEIRNLTVRGQMTFTAARTNNAPFVYENHGVISGCVNEMDITHTGTKNCQYVGGIAAKNYGTIENCVNNGDLSVRNYVGGIAYQNLGGSIINCVNNGSITANNAAGYAGGIVAAIGAASSADVNLIENCTNAGAVTGGSGDYGFAGGIVGQINIASSYATYQSMPSVTIRGCASTGALSAGGGTDEFVAKNNNPDNSTLTIEAGTPAHEHTYDEGVVTEEATCVKDGVRTYTCTGCDENTEGHTKTEIIPATGAHTAGDWAEETVEGEALLVKRCTVCGKLLAKKSAAAVATLANAVQALNDAFFRISPNFGEDTNVCEMISDELKTLGYEDIAVSVAAVENPADGAASIAPNGDISYFYADPGSSRFLWFASIPVTFTLSLEDAEETYEKNAVIRWDADKVKAAVEAQVASKVTEDTIKGENASLDEVTDELVLYKAVKDDAGSDILWSLITWTSSDPSVIAVDDSAQGSADTLFAPYKGVVKRCIEDKTVTLTASFSFQRTSYDEAPITVEKSFTVTVKGMGEEIRSAMQQALDENYLAEKLTYIGTKAPVDPRNVTGDVQLLLPRTSGVPENWNYTFTVESDSPAAEVNAYRLNVYRPLPGEAPAPVTLTVTMKHRDYSDIAVSKTVSLLIAPLSQEEIDAALALMEQVKANLFEGLNDGANEGPDAVVNDLHAFYEAVSDGNGGIRWVYTNAEATGTGISAVSIDLSHPSELWDRFRSAQPDVISHETLLVSRQKENTEVAVDLCLSAAQYERYAALYPENADFAKLCRQQVRVTVTVPGTDPTEEPAPDEPVTPDTPDTPADSTGACKWCGETHDKATVSGWFTSYFHDILFFFFKMAQFFTLKW